jgi:hypothetical protein
MSINTWLDEFYPVSVNVLDKDNLSKLDALEHSLRKWEGFREKNLKRYNVTGGDIRLFIHGDDCALCLKYYDEFSYSDLHPCESCPIYQNNGGKGCSYDPKNKSEYYQYLKYENPLPMIKLLKKLIKREIKNE